METLAKALRVSGCHLGWRTPRSFLVAPGEGSVGNSLRNDLPRNVAELADLLAI